MKALIFCSLFICQFTFALGISEFISDFATGDAEKLCSKRAKIDQPQCNEFIKGKRFRKEFLAVCFSVNKKMGPAKAMSCLEGIADKNPLTASRQQAEVCDELVGSKNFEIVQNCIEANVIAEFADLCTRYVDGSSDKAYKAADQCITTLNGLTREDLDMQHVRGGCLQVKNEIDFTDMHRCLANAEGKKSGNSGGSPKIKAQTSGGAQN